MNGCGRRLAPKQTLSLNRFSPLRQRGALASHPGERLGLAECIGDDVGLHSRQGFERFIWQRARTGSRTAPCTIPPETRTSCFGLLCVGLLPFLEQILNDGLDVDSLVLELDKSVAWHGWHAFRRGLATNLREMGVDGKTIQANLATFQCGNKMWEPSKLRIATTFLTCTHPKAALLAPTFLQDETTVKAA